MALEKECDEVLNILKNGRLAYGLKSFTSTYDDLVFKDIISILKFDGLIEIDETEFELLHLTDSGRIFALKGGYSSKVGFSGSGQ